MDVGMDDQATGSAFADRPVTHSRATFGRMRRRATHVAAAVAAVAAVERLQRTATAGSTQTTEG